MFHFGRQRPTAKQWAVYSIGTAAAVSLVVHFGNVLLASKHGEFVKDLVCSVSKVLPDGDLARLFSSACRAAEDRKITPDEARKVIGRAQQSSGRGSTYFDNDDQNTDLRAEDEVDFAIEGWKRLNPSPKVDPALRRQFPLLTEDQLCVLSQAERYIDEKTIGIRYVGMSVCEHDEVKSSFDVPRS